MTKIIKLKFEVLSEQLQDALKLVEGFIHSERATSTYARYTPSIYTSLLLETFQKNSIARLTASNLDSSISP